MTLFCFVGKLLIWLVGLFWTAGSLLISLVVFWLYKSEFAKRKWQHARGIITQNRISKYPGNDDTDCLEIKFAYQVENDSHESSFMQDLSMRYNKRKLDEFIDKYPIGKEVDIYYDPSQPSSAELRLRTSIWRFVAGFIYLTSLVAIGLFIVIEWWPFN